MPTVGAITLNKVVPGVLDHYLAHFGYDSQQFDGRENRNRPDNLWDPVDDEKDFGAHGKFDSRATRRTPQLWTSTHRDWIATGALLFGRLVGRWHFSSRTRLMASPIEIVATVLILRAR